MEMKNISELNPYDLDEYLGPVWERETISKKVATPPPPVDPLPILNTIDLNVLMESDDEPVIETVMIYESRTSEYLDWKAFGNFLNFLPLENFEK